MSFSNDNKNKKKIFFTAVIMIIMILGCTRIENIHDIQRAYSPNGQLEAVLKEVNGGATTSFGYEIYIGAKNKKNFQRVAALYGAIRNEQAYGVDLAWSDDQTLTIKYLRAKAITFIRYTADIGGQKVNIKLEKGIENYNARPGNIEAEEKKG